MEYHDALSISRLSFPSDGRLWVSDLHSNTLKVFSFPPVSTVTDVTFRGSIYDLPRGLLAQLPFNTVQEILSFVCKQFILVQAIRSRDFRVN